MIVSYQTIIILLIALIPFLTIVGIMLTPQSDSKSIKQLSLFSLLSFGTIVAISLYLTANKNIDNYITINIAIPLAINNLALSLDLETIIYLCAVFLSIVLIFHNILLENNNKIKVVILSIWISLFFSVLCILSSSILYKVIYSNICFISVLLGFALFGNFEKNLASLRAIATMIIVDILAIFTISMTKIIVNSNILLFASLMIYLSCLSKLSFSPLIMWFRYAVISGNYWNISLYIATSAVTSINILTSIDDNFIPLSTIHGSNAVIVFFILFISLRSLFSQKQIFKIALLLPFYVGFFMIFYLNLPSTQSLFHISYILLFFISLIFAVLLIPFAKIYRGHYFFSQLILMQLPLFGSGIALWLSLYSLRNILPLSLMSILFISLFIVTLSLSTQLAKSLSQKIIIPNKDYHQHYLHTKIINTIFSIIIPMLGFMSLFFFHNIIKM